MSKDLRGLWEGLTCICRMKLLDITSQAGTLPPSPDKGIRESGREGFGLGLPLRHRGGSQTL
eukprot:2824953-Amphidinium_carterae.1